MRHMLIRFCIALAAYPLTATAETSAPADNSWAKQKCELYRRAVDDALGYIGREGMRPEFLARNEAFIAGGCVGRGNVCPETTQEQAFANLLTLMTMNEGMASTFVPFGCRS